MALKRSILQPGEDVTLCAENGSSSSFTVTIQDEAGNTDVATVYAQRIVQTQNNSWKTSINDQTPWSSQANREQGIKVWLPYEQNQHLTAGVWSGEATITMWTGTETSEIQLEIETEILSPELVNIATPFESDALSITGSSLYFILTDPSIGPTFVFGGALLIQPLTIPVIDRRLVKPRY